MSAGTWLQWVTAAAYLALFVACLVAGRRREVRPAAVALGMWAANGLLFYVVLLGVYDAVITPLMVAWSALTRLQGILLGVVALVVLVRSDGE